MCLLDNREVRKGWESLKEAVSGMFTKHGAKVLSTRRWDERRMAYPIEGQNRATYLLVYFSSDTQGLPALRRELEFSEPMLRYLITECEQVPESAYEPEAEFDVGSIPADDVPADDDSGDGDRGDGDRGAGDRGAGDRGGRRAAEGSKSGGDDSGGDDADGDDGAAAGGATAEGDDEGGETTSATTPAAGEETK